MARSGAARRSGRGVVRGRTAAALGALVIAAGGCAGARPLVVLDPGHTASQPGAVGVRGVPEVEYDDAFVALLTPRLERAGFRVERTRAPGEELELSARAARAGSAWLLLSIHHDSAQPQLLERRDRDGRPAWRATRPIAGYSLFVSDLNPRHDRSRQIAEALGRRLRALGRPPTLHHAEPIPGEGRPLLDPRLGVYRFDELAVLRLASCPAVLVELGVLVDEADEAYVSDPARREALAEAIVQGLVDVVRAADPGPPPGP
jgi:N-acetylmuramoyl-L-alanine amidase